jgi:hypothetical protein
MVITENASGTFRQCLLPCTYLAGVNLKPASQFGCCVLAFERFQGYPVRWTPSLGQNRGYVKIGSRYPQGIC